MSVKTTSASESISTSGLSRSDMGRASTMGVGEAALWDEVKDKRARMERLCRAASSSDCASRARWR